MSQCLVKFVLLIWSWFWCLKTLCPVTHVHASLNLYVVTHLHSSWRVFACGTKILMRWKPAWSIAPPIPALSCWPLSNFVLPQKAPLVTLPKGERHLFLFSALCCPHATETVLLKLEKECLASRCTYLRTLRCNSCISFKGVSKRETSTVKNKQTKKAAGKNKLTILNYY